MSSLKQIRAKTTSEGLASLHIEHQPLGAHEEYLDRLQRIEAGLLASRRETIRRSFCKALELLRRAQTHRAHLEKQILPDEPNSPP